MTTTDQIQPKPQAQSTIPLPKPVGPITELVKILQSVDVSTPTVQLNETTISDGKGGYIELNNDKIFANDFEKTISG